MSNFLTLQLFKAGKNGAFIATVRVTRENEMTDAMESSALANCASAPHSFMCPPSFEMKLFPLLTEKRISASRQDILRANEIKRKAKELSRSESKALLPLVRRQGHSKDL